MAENFKYVVRMFLDDEYLYSVHCDHVILDDIIKEAKDSGKTIKVVAYKDDSEK